MMGFTPSVISKPALMPCLGACQSLGGGEGSACVGLYSYFYGSAQTLQTCILRLAAANR